MTPTTHGGARPKQRPDDKRGGARQGAGALRRRIQLSKDDAQTLRVLTMARRSLGNEITEVEFVSALIQQAWREYDAAIEEQGE